MRKNEIKIGGVYSNGKGPQYKFYEGQECIENLRYEIVNDGSKKNLTAGEQCNMTVASFASWAKEQVG